LKWSSTGAGKAFFTLVGLSGLQTLFKKVNKAGFFPPLGKQPFF